jgi:ADP-ribose pyrophosphatase
MNATPDSADRNVTAATVASRRAWPRDGVPACLRFPVFAVAPTYNRPMSDVVELVVDSDEVVGREGGFLAIRRMRLRNRRADGSTSRPYLADFLVRPKGIDAVVVAVYCRDGDRVRVLLRDGLRPPLAFGRGETATGETPPIPDGKPYMFFREVCAGIIETTDRGEAGVRERAAIEVEEEAGYRVSAADVALLGAGTFPSPGAMAERYWLAAVPVADPNDQQPIEGDGSPMEEGARTTWMDLDDAITACVAGDIEDAKTELCLRRLRDALAR